MWFFIISAYVALVLIVQVKRKFFNANNEISELSKKREFDFDVEDFIKGAEFDLSGRTNLDRKSVNWDFIPKGSDKTKPH